MGITYMEKISVTIGILTYNSGKTLARCLESVKDFRDILIADGGSTDDTLEIAKRYGARIITQSQEGKPITDFSLERNRLLDEAQEDWFFYVDSDETVSLELVQAMQKAIEAGEFKVFRVRYVVTSADFSVKYRTIVPYYQPRFFSTKIGARFTNKVHERIMWDKSKHPVGTIDAPWYVPLDVQLDFRIYREKVDHRLPLLVERWSPTLSGAIRKGIYEPLLTTFKHLIKIIYLHVRFPAKELVPLRYDFYRIYSQWVMAKCVWRTYLSQPR